MTHSLVDIINAADPVERNRSVYAVCRGASLEQLLDDAAALEAFRHESTNLYERVRALFFLYAIHRFHVPAKLAGAGMSTALIPYAGYEHLLLDTLDEMETARELYKDLGFVEIEPYYHNPIPGAHYLMVAL